ncbi:zeta toxin family protein [Streptomyces sp. NPDC088812]|uniref:zeta toxin family protein n=1 Tax=Streptomyces sp. NPDC088812 TaxID=3365905 RepID=UPI003809EC76
MTDASDYALSQDELEELFERKVRSFIFDGHFPSTQPALVLLGGQMAAGKSHAMQAAQQRHQAAGLIALTVDELRVFHPQYTKLMRDDPLSMVGATTQAATAWNAMAFEHARQHGYSLIIEGTFKNPMATLGDAESFAAADFQVEMVALAVRAERSRLDALYRFLPTAASQPGRWVWPERHQESYAAIPGTVAAGESSPWVHRLRVTNRLAEDLYVNERGADGALLHAAGGAEAVHAERARPFSSDEADSWLSRFHSVMVNFAVGGQVNATTRPALEQVLADSRTVVAMAGEDARMVHAATLPLLMTLTRERVAGASSALPHTLLPSRDLPATPGTSVELARREALSPQRRRAEDALRQAVTDARGEVAASAQGDREGAGPSDGPAFRSGSPVSAVKARARSTTTSGTPAGKSSERGERPSKPSSQAAGQEQQRRRGRDR